MVTYGFYNSVDHDRVYDATQMSEIFDGIIRDGVYQYVGEAFAVSKSSGFQVRVGTGRAWFNHTWTKNDAPLILTLPAPPTMNNYYRADAVVIDIDANVNVRENKITYVKGTEVANNSSPPYPELLNGTHKQVALAYIVRQGEEVEINPLNIRYVVGSSPCPYVTAPLQVVDISTQVAAWEAAWEEWFQGPNGYVQTQKRDFESQIAAAEALITNDTQAVNEDVAEFRVWIASQKSQFNGWMDDSEDTFEAWFRDLRYILDGDVAGHLQNEIEDLQDRVTPIEKGGTGNTKGYIQTGFKDTESTLGDFVTSEGMNTVASGKCAHAEGGGNYSYQHQDNHFEGEDMLSNIHNTDDEYVNYSFVDTIPEGYSRDWKSASGSKITIYPYNISSEEASSKEFNTIHIGYLFTDETTGEILYRGEGSIGPGAYNLDDYIGNKGFRNLTNTGGEQEIDYGNFIDADYVYPDIWKYKGSDGICLDKFEPIDFYIDLPWTGDMTNDGTTVTHPKSTVTGQAISTDTPLSAKTYIIIDIVTGELIGSGEYKESPYNCYGVPDIFGGQTNPKPNPSTYFQMDYVRSNYRDITINSDYSYSLTYYNNNFKHHTYRMLFSNQTRTEVRPNDADTIFKIFKSPDIYLYKNDGSIVLGKNYIKIDASTVRYYGKTGHTYSMKMFLTYSYVGEEDRPLTWVPEGDYIDIEGPGTKALGDFSHAEGYRTIANGDRSHTEGANTTTNGHASHAEGQSTTAGNNFNNTYGDHAEGFQTIATSKNGTVVGAAGAHAEGHTTQALAGGAHAEGYNTIASGEGSHAGGIGAIAYFTGQFVHGTFGFGGNLEIIEDQDKTYTLPNDIKIFNGGLFLMRSNASTAKTLTIQMTKSVDALLEKSRALWVMIIRDVVDSTRSNTTEMPYVGMFFIKFNKRYEATSTSNLVSVVSIKENGTSQAFEFGTHTNNDLVLKMKPSNGVDYLSFEVQFIRVM